MNSERDDVVDLNIALVQMDVALGDKEKNRTAILRMTRDLPEDCDVLVLPELWNIGYDKEHIAEKAETMKGPSVGFLRKLAREKQICIIGGSIAERHEDGIYNTLTVINKKGELAAKYRKAHLFPLGIEEKEMFREGDEWGLYREGDETFGLMLCYDLRFPSFCRNLALRDASVIFVPAQWPTARIDHFKVLLQARAIENQVFVVGVNRCGNDGISYCGGSMIVAPDGSIAAQCGKEEELKVCRIRTDDRFFIRSQIPVFQDRRNIIDEIDNSLF